MKLNIGIIPDGNRKWASKNGCSWEESYIRGAEAAVGLVQEILSRGDVERVVFFALAQENLQLRPPEQVRGILTGIDEFFTLVKDLPIQVSCHGDPAPPEVARFWSRDGDFHLSTPRMKVHLLLNYSAAWDLEIRPVRTASIPPLDLVIRTFGTIGLSGFLPSQSAYAELFFSKKLWPDFTVEEFREILDSYKRSGRRVSGA